MQMLHGRLHICGADELNGYRYSGITHLVSIANPNSEAKVPSWFNGERMVLQFGDVVSLADAKQCGSIAPSTQDIMKVVAFSRKAWALKDSILMVHCDYGASRSPAVAYVIATDYAGVGSEKDALSFILDIRPCAVPNKRIVALGDAYLNRQGALIKAADELYQSLDAEIAQCMASFIRESD